MSLKNKGISAGNLAVITGGADGIGLACAEKYVAHDMQVALLDINAEQLEHAKKALEEAGALEGQVSGFVCNVADRDSLNQTARTIADDLGPVSVLMNNAAIALNPGKPWENPEAWDKILSVNFGGVINAVHAFVPDMIAHGGPGTIINTGSKQGITRPPGNAAYNSAKSGILGYAESLEHDLRTEKGCQIKSHLLVPGFTFTGMIRQYIKEKPESAWTTQQLADFLFESLDRGDFYIICPDNDVDRKTDEKRMAWTMGDIIENRPPLSRWHPDFAEAFADFMKS